MRYPPIENHGVIGDQETAALVGMDGSIDFMCFPNFNSPTVFASLLDRDKGGHFTITPANHDARNKQMYLPDSNILVTRFLFDNGVAEVVDYMPVEPEHHRHSLVRHVTCVRGAIRFRLMCAPRFDYARAEHRVEYEGDDVLFITDDEKLPSLRLRTSRSCQIVGGDAVAEFDLLEGESAAFVLEDAAGGPDSPSAHANYVADSFKRTLNYWRSWISRSQYNGRWQESVNRSALILKLLTFEPTGAIVASPTFGLPEAMGGGRNWDYRYSWVRDAAFTLYALIRLGFTGEAANYMRWIESRCGELADESSLQLIYGIDGEHQLDERQLTHLEGYRGSSPIRIGNAAHNQLQLDIYGALMDAVYLYDKFGSPISIDLWNNLRRLLDWLSVNWEQPDESIWEVRSGRWHFLYSRLMCWVAIDRGVRLARKRSLPAPLDAWLKTRDAIHADIYRNFWDDRRKTFVQHKQTDAVDASTLLMPLVRFISPIDPRWMSTLEAIEKDLVYDSLVYRYRLSKDAVDRLEGEEGTFNMCSFWYAECLSRSGQLDRARLCFDKMLGYGNHVGLYSEELGLHAEQLGNFPQAFTHMALISAAYDLNRRLSASDRSV